MHFASDNIFETALWRVILAQDQTYLDYCIITLKRRDCGDLAKLTNEEMLDFLQLTRKLEATLRKAFNATMFNWSCLMNKAYRDPPPPQPHVHWHCRPRYNHPVSFAGLDFPDTLFGHHYEWPQNERLLDTSTRKMVIDHVQKNIV